jgi:capsular polysaccharide biosynthesis protein
VVEGVAMDPRRALLVTREVMGKGQAPYRRIVNEAAVVQAMEDAGLAVTRIDFAGLSHAEQVRAVRGAGVFVGMHGAGMANLVWLHDTAVVVELHPFGFQKWGYERLARYLRQPYVAWVNEHANNSIPTQASSRYAGPDEDYDYYRHRDQIVGIAEFTETLRKALLLAAAAQSRAGAKPQMEQ